MGKLDTVQNGKGSKKRPADLKKFLENFDDIIWTRQETKHTSINENDTNNSPASAQQAEGQS